MKTIASIITGIKPEHQNKYDLIQFISDFFEGHQRSGRIEYISLLLINLMIFLTVMYCSAISFHTDNEAGFLHVINIMSLLMIFITLIIRSLLITIRRLHDIGLSGVFSMVIFIFGFAIFLMLIPGNKSDNYYGEKPEAASKAHSAIALLFVLVIGFALIHSSI